MLRHVSFRHDARLARTLGQRTEKRVGSFSFDQKFVCGHVDHSKTCHARTLRFRTEKRHEPLAFEEKLFVEHVFSVNTPTIRRPFRAEGVPWPIGNQRAS